MRKKFQKFLQNRSQIQQNTKQNDEQMSNQFTMNLTNNFGSISEKVGVTTTVKEQCDNIEVTVEHLKKCLQLQRKQQNELDSQLLNLQKIAQAGFRNMLGQISLNSKRLIQSFKQQSSKQSKESQYLQLQKKILEEQQSKLSQLSNLLGERVGQMQQNVGI